MAKMLSHMILIYRHVVPWPYSLTSVHDDLKMISWISVELGKHVFGPGEEPNLR